MILPFLVFLVFIQHGCCILPPVQPLPCASELRSHRNWRLLDTSNICGVSGPSMEPRIVGGRLAKEGEFPWMTMILTSVSGINFCSCGGAVINERYILTAAHCLSSFTRFVQVGGYDNRKTSGCYGANCQGQNIEIEEKIPHERYDPVTTVNDIALIRLKEKIRFNENIKPICMPTSCSLVNKNFNGIELLLAGWGNTEPGGKQYFGPLRKVEVVAMNLNDCRQRWGTIPDSKICTRAWNPRGGIRGMNNGDSGGPLVYRDDKARHFAIGVVSYRGSDDDYRGVPQVYARVASYMTWILDKMRP